MKERGSLAFAPAPQGKRDKATGSLEEAQTPCLSTLSALLLLSVI